MWLFCFIADVLSELSQTSKMEPLPKKFMVESVDVVLCAIWYHSYNLKNVKNTHGGVLLLVKLQA